jgi:hypothetical protein
MCQEEGTVGAESILDVKDAETLPWIAAGSNFTRTQGVRDRRVAKEPFKQEKHGAAARAGRRRARPGERWAPNRSDASTDWLENSNGLAFALAVISAFAWNIADPGGVDSCGTASTSRRRSW